MPPIPPGRRVLVVVTEGGSLEQVLPDDDETAWDLISGLVEVVPLAVWQVRVPET
jgi:hypothetical protein